MIVHGSQPESFADWVEMGKHFTRVMGQFLASVRHASKDRKGSAISMMAAGLIPVIAALGSGIDAARMYVVKSQLQAGVDAAALAGARAFAVTDTSNKSRTKQVEAYFYGNFPNSPPYMGVTGLKLTPAFAVVDGINVTTVTAEAVVPMSFMSAFGVAGQKMIAVAKAELQPRPLEVMVVLDDTGSMKGALSGGKTRETALKEAAKDFIDILHQGAATRRDLAIGFIGYDVTVNVGHLLEAARPGSVVQIDGFNDPTTLSMYGRWPANHYAWKGCVSNDSTVKNVSSDRTLSEAGAWDLTRWLPGENGNPPVRPYFVPPMWVPNYDSGSKSINKADPDNAYYDAANVEPGDNRYKLNFSGGTPQADYLASKEIYRKYFYEYYIDLNDGNSTKANDVIRGVGGAYFDKNSPDNWFVDWANVPQIGDWRNPSDAIVNKFGGRTSDGTKDTTPMPSPNWQCPEEAMPVQYGRQSSEYKARVDEKHAAIYPANGTIHHAGLLWGYRLLVRDDIFTRANPTNEQPRRAIVFMTDGTNEIGESQKGYTDRTYSWYGRWTDKSISTNASDTETQMLRRFEKTCANIQRETNPPEVYIISLVAKVAVFNQCAPGRVYQTSNTTQLKQAFQDVAAELVDLHLVQ